MNPLQATVFDLLLNALLQITLFAIVAAAFSRLIAKAKAKHQYVFYLVALLFCLTAPVINTLWRSPAASTTTPSHQQSPTGAGGPHHHLWPWQGESQQHQPFTIAPALQSCLLSMWGIFVLVRLARFSRGVHRVHRLRSGASTLSPAHIELAHQIIDRHHRVALLESTAIDDPVTVGVFHPAILLPSKLLPHLSDQELLAVMAHEYGHIRRQDFLVHILSQLISLPVAWHPGIRYLMSKLSQARELSCDDYAASHLGTRRLYARMLLRLASLCLHARRANAVGLGIFDGENLEARIMTLTEKRILLPRAALMGLALAMTMAFGTGAVLARATSVQADSASANTTQTFAGTWHWMFNGRSFATMILVPDASGITGTVTGSRIALDNDGALSRADPSEDSAPKPILKATPEGSALHITVGDGNEPFEFLVTLKDETHAEIHPKGAPPNMKPILAEKVH